MNMRVKLTGLFVGGLLATTALSSIATQYVAKQLGHHPSLGQPITDGFYEPFGWMVWQNASWAAQVRPAFLWPNLTLSGLVLVVFVVVAAKKIHDSQNKRKPKPFVDVHGSAEWASEADIRGMGLLDNAEGLYVGAWENPRTNVVHYLRDNSGAHIAGMAPTRSGKGLGWVLPNLLSWTDSLFVYDPKGELWQLTAGWRKSVGQNVLRWQPGHPSASCGFNFLDTIRLGTPFEVADAQNMAAMLIDQEGKGFGEGASGHFNRISFGFLTGLILHCLHTAADAGTSASLPSVTALLSSPKVDPMVLCKAMAASKYGAAINAAGVDQLSRDARERDGMLSTVKGFLSLFLDPVIARNTDYSSFRLRDLMHHDKPTSLYILVPGADSLRLRPLVRLFITMMINHAISTPVAFDANQKPIYAYAHRMLMMMEEFPELRQMPTFERSMAIMAGAGLTAFLIMQDREQLLGAYGAHQTVMANIHITAAYAPNEGKTADWLSHELGNRTVNLEQYSASGKRGGRLSNLSHSFHAISRPLKTSDEIRRLRGPVKEGTKIVAPGEMLILPTGERPILGRQVLYFQDPIFDARSRILPPAVTDDLELLRQFKVGAV